MNEEDIDRTLAVVLDLLDVGAQFYHPLALALPVLQAFVKLEARKLKEGLASGTIVPDGHGGFVPASNSRFDPKTGEFE